jgi:SAM-dependent methyltransferase
VNKPELDIREAPEPPLQLDTVLKFQQQVFGQMTAALIALATYMGDRLGLFRALAEGRGVTAADLARQLDLCPDMTAEWLRVMACAGTVQQFPETGTYALPGEHAVALAAENSPMFIGGAAQQVLAFAAQMPALLEAFRDGGGVAQDAYPRDLWEGMERLSATWFEHELVESWISALPSLHDKLSTGALVADVGCGSGRALIRMAKAFPASRFVGYDLFQGAVDRATRNAEAAGLSDRVRFERHDVMDGIRPEFDLVTSFDSLHDLPDPIAGLKALAGGLNEDGKLLVLELALDAGEESGPLGIVLHATKLFYNLPVALAGHRDGSGSKAFPEEYIRSLCRKAGVAFVRTLPVRNPLHKLYVMAKPAY